MTYRLKPLHSLAFQRLDGAAPFSLKDKLLVVEADLYD